MFQLSCSALSCERKSEVVTKDINTLITVLCFIVFKILFQSSFALVIYSLKPVFNMALKWYCERAQLNICSIHSQLFNIFQNLLLLLSLCIFIYNYDLCIPKEHPHFYSPTVSNLVLQKKRPLN
jgi:hypothetical protein